MKLARLLIVAVTANLVACASAQKTETVTVAPPAPAPAVQVPVPQPYALPAQAMRTVTQAPAWFIQLPESTAEMVFAAATATSVDEQMAYSKARMFAEQKLIEQTRSVIRTQTKSYRNDTGASMVESFETVVRKNANGELIGAQRVDSQVTFDGRQYKVYVLLRLPMGDANTMAKESQAKKLRQEAELRGARAHQDLDRAVETEKQEQERADEKQRQEIGPRAESAVTTVSVPVSQGELKLLDVENAEYKKKRAEALEKPGAVIGQTTLR